MVRPLHEIIIKCQQNDSSAQKELFKQFKGKMMGVCRRYIRIEEDAEDVFVSGFYKILTKINSYKGAGSFEGWMRRIIVNECLMFLRKRNNFNLSIESDEIDIPSEQSIESDINFEELIQAMQILPPGYRTVLNMYVVEGYKHKEIAEQLGISINTSKSQLIAAKRKFRAILKKKQSRTG